MVVLIIFLIYNLIKFLIQMGGNSYGINYMSELWGTSIR